MVREEADPRAIVRPEGDGRAVGARHRTRLAVPQVVQPQRHHPGLGGGIDEAAAIRGEGQSKEVVATASDLQALRSDPRGSQRLRWGRRSRRSLAPVTNRGNGEDDRRDHRQSSQNRSFLYTEALEPKEVTSNA